MDIFHFVSSAHLLWGLGFAVHARFLPFAALVASSGSSTCLILIHYAMQIGARPGSALDKRI